MVQLRQDNALGTLFNMVGFQTKLKHAEQVASFGPSPASRRREFARLGGLHRNTFINSPRLLDGRLRLKAAPHVRFAGQITGVEGYVESAAMGLLAGRFAGGELLGARRPPPPAETAHGALLAHITGGAVAELVPADERQLRALFPPLPAGTPKESRKRAQSERALAALDAWRATIERDAAAHLSIAQNRLVLQRMRALPVASTPVPGGERRRPRRTRGPIGKRSRRAINSRSDNAIRGAQPAFSGARLAPELCWRCG